MISIMRRIVEGREVAEMTEVIEEDREIGAVGSSLRKRVNIITTREKRKHHQISQKQRKLYTIKSRSQTIKKRKVRTSRRKAWR